MEEIEPDELSLSHGSSAGSGHLPRENFIELDILSGKEDNETCEWKEVARWIKYEEDVEEGSNRWGRPHVPSVSYHSLNNLRKLMEKGIILFDLEEAQLPEIMSRVVDHMIIEGIVRNEAAQKIKRLLLLQHKHVEDSSKNWKLKSNAGSLANIRNSQEAFQHKNPPGFFALGGNAPRRNSTSATATRGLNDNIGINSGRKGSIPGNLLGTPGGRDHSSVHMRKLSYAHPSEEDVRWMSKDKDSIIKRIPVGAEATVIFAGVDDSLDEPVLVFVRLVESAYMPNVTEAPIPVRFVIIVMGPPSYDFDYKEIGRSIATLLTNAEFRTVAYKTLDRKHLLKGLQSFLEETVVFPAGKYEENLIAFEMLQEKNAAIRLRKERLSISNPSGVSGFTNEELAVLIKSPETLVIIKENPLKRTGRCFGGLFNDIRRRFPFYWTDIKDGLDMQCLAAVIFIAFAQISGSIAFGGLMGAKTNNVIGIVETLFTSAFGGIIFSLFSGQPLLIVATTGPLLLFDDSLFKFCESNQIDFLAMRTWIGFWLALVALIFVAFELSSLVRFVTRFTQEIFASLISLLFIAESLQNLVEIYLDHPLLGTYGECEIDPDNSSTARLIPGSESRNQPNTALLCSALMIGTFYVAWTLKSFRASTYLTKTIRHTLGNFCVPISIGCLVLLDYMIRETVTKKLDAPKGFQPTIPRPWIINPGLIAPWLAAVAVLPSLLLFILLFMEVSVAELIVSKEDNKLKKGSGFHLDILLMCFINALLSVFGLPWASLPLVRGLAHVSALTVMSTNNAPGEKPTVVGLKEQRLTATVVSILTGASVTMASVLELMPMAVLFGVFLFMGVASIAGIEFFERLALFFKQVENHPPVPYVRRVPTVKMHFFTAVQIFWLAVLWGIKYTSVALSFPFILLVLIPFRLFILNHIFSKDELSALDSGGEEKLEKNG